MWRFWWHRIFHRMKCAYEHILDDSARSFYLCKCGKAWKVTRSFFDAFSTRAADFSPTAYEEVDPEPLEQFLEDVGKDVTTQ